MVSISWKGVSEALSLSTASALSSQPPSSGTRLSSSSLTSHTIQPYHSFLVKDLVLPSYLTPSQYTHTHTEASLDPSFVYVHKYP